MRRSLKSLGILAGLAWPTLGAASPLAPWVGPDILPGEDPAALPSGTGRNQAEPHATRSATDPDLILATFQEGRFADGGARNNGFAVSEDGGLTWRRGLNPWLTLIAGGPYFRASDPVAAISRDGLLFLNSLVALDSGFDRGRLVIQRSGDRGRSWTGPITIYTGPVSSNDNRIFPDKNWMTIDDYATSPHPDRLVVTWTNFRTLRNSLQQINDALIMAALSDDFGETWSEPVYVTPPSSELNSTVKYQGSQPVFLPGGALAVVYHSFQNNRLEVRYSPDGGKAFPYPAQAVHAGYRLFDAPNMREGLFLPSVDAARETGDLFVVYTHLESSTDSFGKIHFVRSRRLQRDPPVSGAPDWRFTEPVKISGDLPVRVVATPTVAVSPDGQRVVVFFYDNRNGDALNNFGDFYAVQSADGGVTWSAAFRLTPGTFDIRRATETDSGYMLGDYFGMAAPEGPGQAALAVWVDTRRESADPWAARIADPTESVFASWLQARLPFFLHAEGPGNLRYADPDRDGIPNLLEYILGRSPLEPEPQPTAGGGPGPLSALKRLAPATDPALAVAYRPGSGRWPVLRGPLDLPEETAAVGEGYWESVTWPADERFEQLEIAINGEEFWYLLPSRLPFRMVRREAAEWVWSSWFGFLYTPATALPWIFHPTLGWLYEQSGFLYSHAFATWVYPDVRFHPWVLRQDGSWLYLIEGAPWVYDTASGQWLRTY